MKVLHKDNILPLNAVEDSKLKYMVLAARHKNQWVIVRLKGDTSWGFPGGHREEGETMDEAARRELFEETGAVDYDIAPLALYGVDHGDHMSWGSIYSADIRSFDPLPEDFEIEELSFTDHFPLDNARFPDIMPEMMAYLEGCTDNKS